jgi:hypothetical protein
MFCQEALGTPLEPSKLSGFARSALEVAAIDKPLWVWHGLRHTARTAREAALIVNLAGREVG